MTITIELPHELEQELSSEAARQGLPLAEYALRILATGRPARQMPITGAELVDYWHSEGLIGSRSDIADSQDHARHLREQAERRVRD
ncbi:MAG: hypothetical protein M3R24_25945 [Chloroflexota bacterium]|nr:hypothetical protein [Chloroflexota bacterium]